MLQDLKYAARAFFRTRGFTTAAVLALALGIGGTSAMFSVVQAAIIRPVPFSDPDALYVISERLPDGQSGRLTPLDFADLRREIQSFEAVAAHVGTGFSFTGDGDAQMVLGQLTTPEFFHVLRTPPAIGGTFGDAESEAGHDTVAVLSHGLWQQRFGGDASVVDRLVTINNRRYRIAGVMPRGFDYPNREYVLWTPLAMRGTITDGPPINRAAHYMRVVGRLKPGVTAMQARHELDGLASRLSGDHPHPNLKLELQQLSELTAAPVRDALLLLLGGVGCLLVIACANVTGLSLARATARSGELAVRAALGATRWRLARQLLTETMLLYAIGGGAGLMLASWTLEGVRRFGPDDVPRLQAATIDARVLWVTVAATVLSALVFGIGPSLRAARHGIRGTAGDRTTTADARIHSGRNALVVVQIALSLMLLVVAGLLGRSFLRLQAVDKGFDPDGVVTFSTVLLPQRYPAAAHIYDFADRLVSALDAHPSVAAVGTTTALPLSGQNIENRFTIQGYQPAPGEEPIAGLRGLTADYFAAIAATLRAGRVFSPADHERAEPVVIVNERFARMYFADREPVGGRVKMGPASSTDAWRTVVGVVRDVRHSGLVQEPRPEVYLPFRQLDADFVASWARGIHFAARVTGDPAPVLSHIRGVVRSIDADVPVNDLQPMRVLVADAVSEPRFRLLLFGAFAATAATLAAVGLFGVMAFFVAQRTREIGIRVALGAGMSEVLRLILGRAGRLAFVGIASGLAAAAIAARALQTLLFHVDPIDPLTFVAAAALLLGVALTASIVPARRALQVDPVTALRAE